MSVRTQRGQGTRKTSPDRVGRPGLGRTRNVTVPPVIRHDPAPAILGLKAEVDRLINEVGTRINDDGQIGDVNGLAPGMLTGKDRKVVTGTAGTSGNLAQWNGDGDAVDASVVTADVATGPSSATDNSVPTYDGTTGKLLQDQGAVLIDDSGQLGIGASPAYPLDVLGNARVRRTDGESPNVRIQTSGGAATQTWLIQNNATSGAFGVRDVTGSATPFDIEAGAPAGSLSIATTTGNISVGGTVDGRDIATDGGVLDGLAAASGPIPSGTVMLFRGTSVPTGWTLDTTDNGKYIRIVNSASEGTGGSGLTYDADSFLSDHAAHSHGVTGLSVTGSTASALSTNVVAHTHTVTIHTDSTAAESGIGVLAHDDHVASGGAESQAYTTSSTSSGSAHTHAAGTLDVGGTLSDSSAQSHTSTTWTPAYREWFAASKD